MPNEVDIYTFSFVVKTVVPKHNTFFSTTISTSFWELFGGNLYGMATSTT
jgi:hypothetical protein